jgi:hypothetical protein
MTACGTPDGAEFTRHLLKRSWIRAGSGLLDSRMAQSFCSGEGSSSRFPPLQAVRAGRSIPL